MSADTLQTELEAWCASYVSAFEAFDVDAIGMHWAFPATLVSGGRTIAIKDANTFNRNTQMLTGFYERQNARCVTREIVEVMAMGNDTAAMRVRDQMSTPEGDALASWVSAYVLQKTRNGWRAIFADAQGELDAWDARGTPLGS